MPKPAESREAPPGEFVSEDLERDCVRFLEELRRRAIRTEGFRPLSEK